MTRKSDALGGMTYLKAPLLPSSAAPDCKAPHQTLRFILRCYQFSALFANPSTNGWHTHDYRQIAETLWTS